jgi:hypothetical protein
MRTTRLLPLVAVVLLLQACGWNGIKVKRTDTLQAPHVDGSALSIRGTNGKIDVAADPGLDQVVIDARITCSASSYEQANRRLEAAFINVERLDDGTLEIEPRFPLPRRGNDAASMTVRVPSVDGVTVSTSNGRIVVEGLAGPLRARTSNGRVTVRDHNGPADIVTSNGAVVISGHVGTLAVGTSNGNVEAAGVTGPSRIRTSNGHVNLHVASSFAGAVTFDTSNGSITVIDQAGRITETNMRRSSGRVVVGSGGEHSNVDTSNGSIKFVISDS